MTMKKERRLSLSLADWERLSAYVDEALPPHERRLVEQHLRQDPAWQQAHRELEGLRAELRALPQPQRPRSFVLSPDMVAASRPWWPPRRTGRWAWAFGAVLAMVVAALAVFLPWRGSRYAVAPLAPSGPVEGAALVAKEAEATAPEPTAQQAAPPPPRAMALPQAEAVAAPFTPTPTLVLPRATGTLLGSATPPSSAVSGGLSGRSMGLFLVVLLLLLSLGARAFLRRVSR